jgi:putative FmdB family regulatory protein
MPLFEYKCDECGSVTEVLEKKQRNSATGFCPTCTRETSFTKLFSLFAAPAGPKDDGLGMCGEPRGTCGGGACGCAHH